MGADVKALLERSQAMVERCGDGGAVRDNPAVRLGAALAGLARAGRDKVTLVTCPRRSAPSVHGSSSSWPNPSARTARASCPSWTSRSAARRRTAGTASSSRWSSTATRASTTPLAALDEAGHPVIRIALADPLDIGAEFFRWEMATATAAAVLGVNPFDEPDVGAARSRTAAILSGWRTQRRMPEWPVAAEDAAHRAPGARRLARSHPWPRVWPRTSRRPGRTTTSRSSATCRIPRRPWSRLQALRVLVRDRLRIATTVGLGPEYLHATDQLHKGGRNNGLFIQITGEDKDDLTIPGVAHGFSTLKAAQAQSDLETLHAGGRRVIRLRLAGKAAQGLQELLQIARTATRRL